MANETPLSVQNVELLIVEEGYEDPTTSAGTASLASPTPLCSSAPPTPVLYNSAWYESLEQYREWNERAMWAAFAHLGRPKSFLDIGCGDGWMVRAARMLGTRPSIGIEGIDVPKPTWAQVIRHDLREPLVLRVHHLFDLVVSIEVGEHLPPESADVYVESVARHVGKWLVFTAAAPGQGGEGHVNCQPQEYWREKFEAHGLLCSVNETDRLRETWKWVTGPMFWLPQNLQVFFRPSAPHEDEVR